MGYKALITLDLVEVTKEQKQIFHAHLKTKKWSKIPKLTTAWSVDFADNRTREDALTEIENDLKFAKLKAKVHSAFHFAIQLANPNPITVNEI